MHNSKKAVVAVAMILTVAVLSLAGCGAGTSERDQSATTLPTNSTSSGATVTPTALDGAALYASNCAGCHGALASSSKTGATVARIQTAISSNVGGMGSMSSLTPDMIQAISVALGGATTTATTTSAGTTTPTTTPTTTIDGATLYAANCAGCHGALASSSKIGITLAQLQTGISSNIGGMGSLSSLSAAQLQAIVTALASPTTAVTPAPAPTPTTTPAPTTQTWALYNQYCSGCHGTSKQGAAAATIQNAINTNIGGMGSLKSLTAAQISALAAGQ